MKVGDYVRTKDGIILKIKDVEDIYTNDNVYIGMAIYDNEGHFVNDVEIIKSSQKIIDLIEVGDIAVVSGVKYTIVRADDIFDGRLFIQKIGHYPSFTTIKYLIEEKQLQAIVTKENFESMEYKIGE